MNLQVLKKQFQTKNNTVAFYYDSTRKPTQNEIEKILQGFKKELNKSIKLQVSGNRFFFGGESNFIEHIELDVAESLVNNIVGKNKQNLKSKLLVFSDEGYTVQPCFVLTKKFGSKVISEIDRLFKFVTGIDGVGYFNDNVYYIDTQTNQIEHGALDVAEILTRRSIQPLNIKVKTQGFKALPAYNESESDEKMSYGGKLKSEDSKQNIFFGALILVATVGAVNILGKK